MQVKTILIAALALILACAVPLTTYAADTYWTEAYWETVASNITWYYTQAGYKSSMVYDAEYGWISYYDFTQLDSAALATYLSYGYNNFGSVTLKNGQQSETVYKWWLPLGFSSGYVSTYGVMVDIFMPYTDRIANSDGSYTPINGAWYAGTVTNPYVTFEGASTKNAGGTTAIAVSDTNLQFCGTIENFCNYYKIDTYPFPFPFDNITYTGSSSQGWAIRYVIEPAALTDCDALGVTLYAGYGGSGYDWDHYINPYTCCVIPLNNIKNTDVGGGDEGGEDQIDYVEEINGKLDSIINPSPEIESEVAEQESHADSVAQEIESDLEYLEQITEPDYDAVIDAADEYIANYDADQAKKFLGVFFEYDIVVTMVVLTLFFSFMSFILYGKKA